jgi:hypothetical protein
MVGLFLQILNLNFLQPIVGIGMELYIPMLVVLYPVVELESAVAS